MKNNARYSIITKSTYYFYFTIILLLVYIILLLVYIILLIFYPSTYIILLLYNSEIRLSVCLSVCLCEAFFYLDTFAPIYTI